MYQESYNARAEPLFCSLNLLFSDVPVAVAVVVILNSLVYVNDRVKQTLSRSVFIMHGFRF